MHPSTGRRLTGAIAVALLAGAASGSPAAAQSRCTAPDEPGWRSCLAVSHRAIDGGPLVLVTRVRPRLVTRYEDGCPRGKALRRVVVRTGDGARLARIAVRRRCRRGLARWSVNLRLDRELAQGTVVRSFWSGIADRRSAPRVRLRR